MLYLRRMKILSVSPNGVAKELGIQSGDFLLSFDGHAVVDVLDYDYYNSAEHFTMTVKRGNEVTDYEIEKDEDEDLGLELSRDIPVRQCRNRCVFCFVDQLPKTELRSTLRVKDDDYRHSFIFGNYVTLTNLSEKDLARIIRLKLSPLFVSVHAADPALRRKLLGIEPPQEIPDILEQLRTLHAGGIQVHAQAVLCAGLNDDIDDLIAKIEPYTASLALVPVGLTKGHNPALRPLTKDEAARILGQTEAWQQKLLSKRGTRYVFAADELYLRAGLPVPPYEAYEDFSQIENGVGLIASFKHDFEDAIARIEKAHIGECSIATGVSAYPLIRDCAAVLTQKFGGTIRVYEIKNDFFGHTVTVAGLLTGRDILAQLKGKPLGERLVLPRVMLREFSDAFLDDMTVSQLSASLGVPVEIAGADGESLVLGLIGQVQNG